MHLGIGYPYFAYTNHTLLPEALETWGENLFEKVLPRHTQLVREINRRFIENEVCSNGLMIRKKEFYGNSFEGNIKMAFLSVVGSKSVNGVAALHTKLLREKLLRDLLSYIRINLITKQTGLPQEDGCLVVIEISKLDLFCDW